MPIPKKSLRSFRGSRRMNSVVTRPVRFTRIVGVPVPWRPCMNSGDGKLLSVRHIRSIDSFRKGDALRKQFKFSWSLPCVYHYHYTERNHPYPLQSPVSPWLPGA